MKIVATKKMANGNLQYTVNVSPDEKLMAVNENAHYKLGGQLEDIVNSDVLTESRPVFWDIFTQTWLDV